MKEATKYNEELTRKNARVRYGTFRYRINEVPIIETEIVLDTSGSISEKMLKNFLRECRYIIEESKVKVGCFDTKFYGFHEIKSLKDIDEMEYAGGRRNRL